MGRNSRRTASRTRFRSPAGFCDSAKRGAYCLHGVFARLTIVRECFPSQSHSRADFVCLIQSRTLTRVARGEYGGGFLTTDLPPPVEGPHRTVNQEVFRCLQLIRFPKHWANCAPANNFSEARLKTRSVKDEMRDNLIARLKARETGVSRHRGLRGHGDPADCERRSVEAELHSAGAARAGEEPHSARADGAAGRADAVRGGLRDSRQSLPAAVPALPRPDCGARRRNADCVARRATSATWRSWPRRT